MILYGIPHCDTVKQARAWLDAHHLAYTFHDFKKQGVSQEILQRWLGTHNWETLLNKRGKTWRQLTTAEKAEIVNQERAIAAMIQSSSLIKRPVLETDSTIYIGFDPDNYKALLT